VTRQHDKKEEGRRKKEKEKKKCGFLNCLPVKISVFYY